MICHPAWPCLGYRCPRCNRERQRKAEREKERRVAKEAAEEFLRGLRDRRLDRYDDPKIN